MRVQCGLQEMVPKYPCWFDFPWLRPACRRWAEPKLGMKHEPGLLICQLNSSSLRACSVCCFCYEDLLIHREKGWKVWSDLPLLSLKWDNVSRFHRDHIHWCCNSDFCSWSYWKQPDLAFSFVVVSPLHKCHRFWEVLNIWWMFPKAKCTPNVLLM